MKKTGEKGKLLRVEKSEWHFRTLIESAPLAIAASRGGITIYANARYLKMFGFQDRGEIYGHPFSEQIAPQCVSDMERWLSQREKNLPPYDEFETVGLRKDGSQFPFYVAVSRVELEGGPADAGIFADITERKQAEDALRNSEKKYRRLYENLMDAFVSVGMNGKIIEFNTAFLSMLGYSPVELKDLTCNEVTPEKWHQMEKDIVDKQVMTRGYSDIYEKEYRRKDGTVFPVELRTLLLRDDSGDPNNMWAIVRDITERKKAENALKESERRFRTLLANIPGIVYRCVNDRDWTMEFISEGCFAVTGYVPSALINNARISYNDLICADDRAAVWETIQMAVREKSPFQMTYRILTAAGDTRWVWEQGRCIYDDKGEPVALEGFISDITEHKHSEEALHESEERLRKAQAVGFVGAWEYNLKLGMIWGSEAGFGIFGLALPSGYVPADTIESRIVERERVHQSLVDLIEKGTKYDIEYAINPAGGEQRKIITSMAELIRDEKGNPVKVVGVIQDITKRKRAEESLEESYVKLKRSIGGIISAITTIVETRDPYTAGHQRRVSLLATAIAKELEFADDSVNSIRVGALLHDIGKIYVPAEILSKPGNLSTVEREIIKVHPRAGYDILKKIDFPWPVAQIALQHQERLNGGGYPQQLAGKDIIIEARIVSVADVVEAMSFYRPYRGAIGMEKALEEIIKGKGILYDPDAVDACVKLIREKKFSFEEQTEKREPLPV